MRRDDSGLTLIELMVAGLILSLVMVAAGGIMIGIMTAQRTVSAVTQSTSQAQTAASQIAATVRNASDLRVTTSGSDQLLVVRTAGRGSTLSWSCRAWYFDASAGEIRTTTAAEGTRMTVPTETQLASWVLSVSEVAPRSGSEIFILVSGGVEISFDARVGDGPPIAIETTAITRTGVGEVGSCF